MLNCKLFSRIFAAGIASNLYFAFLLEPLKFQSGNYMDSIVQVEYLSIDLARFVKRTNERMNRLAAARQMVVSDPELLGGAPVVRGTRIPVHDVAASVAAGLPTDRILAAYPSLDAEKIELAAIYAEANPTRGRPRTSDEFPRGAVIVADRRVPRGRKAG